MPTRLTKLDCYNRHRLFEYKGAQGAFLFHADPTHGAERPLRVQDTQVHFPESAHSPCLSRQSSSVRAAFVRRLHLSQHSSDQRRNPMVARAPEADGRVP